MYLEVLWCHLGPEPDCHGQPPVVHQVECGQVRALLPQHEEEGVKEVHELGDEVPPGHLQRGQPRVAVEDRCLLL